MEKGKIIFLNGVSSAGKSTLSKALQARLPEPYYYLANDTFCDMSPEKFAGIDAERTYRTALKGLHLTIRTFSDAGINSVVDDVLLKTEGARELDDCVELLHGHPVLFVHVVCSLDELRRREIQRGDRDIGHAESQLAILAPQDIYDMTVDTSACTTEACADQIIKRLASPEGFSAFKLLSERLRRQSL